MASAIISGLTATTFASSKTSIHVSEPWDVNRAKIAALGVRTTTSNAEAANGATILILAVKPQVAKAVCLELAGGAWATTTDDLPVVVSIAAGITVDSLQKWCTVGGGREGARVPPVVRVMPNTPALLGEGASGVFAAEGVTEVQKGLVTVLLGSVSKVTEWVEKEELLDVVTGLSGELYLSCAFPSPSPPTTSPSDIPHAQKRELTPPRPTKVPARPISSPWSST